MEARIVARPAFRIVGLQYRGNNANDEISQLWRDFWPRHAAITGGEAPDAAYGVISDFDEERGEFRYIAGVETGAGASVPEDMATIDVPAATYAVFDCTLPTIRPTIDKIYGTWLPASEYTRAPGPELELYDERFDMEHGKLDMAVWVPVVPR